VAFLLVWLVVKVLRGARVLAQSLIHCVRLVAAVSGSVGSVGGLRARAVVSWSSVTLPQQRRGSCWVRWCVVGF
ncbi:hypothetical protein NDU88_000157, partial [Pleurodeles waltl]